jgi:hypothetical protein
MGDRLMVILFFFMSRAIALLNPWTFLNQEIEDVCIVTIYNDAIRHGIAIFIVILKVYSKSLGIQNYEPIKKVT